MRLLQLPGVEHELGCHDYGAEWRAKVVTENRDEHLLRFVDVDRVSRDGLGERLIDRFVSVLRWEFRPGSTMFAVWTHERDGFDPRFRDRAFNSEYSDLFALHPDNTFLIKLAYWLNQ